MHLIRILLLLGLAGSVPTPVAGAEDWPREPTAPELDNSQWARLRGGEVLVENTLLAESGGAAAVHALFWAQPDDVWNMLGDCSANFRYVDGLRECEILESSIHRAVTRQSVKKSLVMPRLDFVFETYREPPRWVVIRLSEGELKQLNGSWRLDPVEGGDALLISHSIQVQPKLPAPKWLVRQTLRRDVGDMVACLRSLAGASGSAENEAADSARCPER